MSPTPPGSGTLPGMEAPSDPAIPSGSAAPSGSTTSWLAELEQRVRQAVTEIGRLRQENRRLERELAKVRKSSGARSADEVAVWERERTEVRERVERLVRHLAELLAVGAADDLRAGDGPPAGD